MPSAPASAGHAPRPLRGEASIQTGASSVDLKSSVTRGLAFYTAGALMACVSSIVYAMLDSRPRYASPADWNVDWISETVSARHIVNRYVATEFALLAVVLAAVLIVRALLLLPVYPLSAAGRVITFPLRVAISWCTICGALGAATDILRGAICSGERPWRRVSPSSQSWRLRCFPRSLLPSCMK